MGNLAGDKRLLPLMRWIGVRDEDAAKVTRLSVVITSTAAYYGDPFAVEATAEFTFDPGFPVTGQEAYASIRKTARPDEFGDLRKAICE